MLSPSSSTPPSYSPKVIFVTSTSGYAAFTFFLQSVKAMMAVGNRYKLTMLSNELELMKLLMCSFMPLCTNFCMFPFSSLNASVISFISCA
ncbi:hypothetical protein SLE2022_009550 [Rubroshorea leprosula]